MLKILVNTREGLFIKPPPAALNRRDDLNAIHRHVTNLVLATGPTRRSAVHKAAPLGRHTARTVIASFFVVFVLIYSIDLVELLRRSGDSQRATGILMAGLSFLRTPTLAEQALPFAVLFGSMIAFLNLSRKMELVVARAAGVSEWQILIPPLLVILAIGIFSITAYNPASAWMKLKADQIKSSVFGGPALGSVGM